MEILSTFYTWVEYVSVLPYIHTFNGLFSRTTWVSRHQKGKPFWILLKQEMMRCEWHQLDYMQIICATLQTDIHASTPSLNFLRAGCSSWRPTNSVKALCYQCTQKHHSNQWTRKTPQNFPFPVGALDPHVIHQSLGPPHTAAWSLHVLLHNYATTSSLITMGCPISIRKMGPFHGVPTPQSTCLVLGPSRLTIQIQSAIFPQYTGETQTHRWDRRHHPYQ